MPSRVWTFPAASPPGVWTLPRGFAAWSLDISRGFAAWSLDISRGFAAWSLDTSPRLRRLLCGESLTHRPRPTPQFSGGYAAFRRTSDGLNVARPFKAGNDIRAQCPRRVSD